MPHFLDRSVSISRWDNEAPPRLTIAPGDTVRIETRDATDGQVQPGMTADAFAQIDPTRIHGLTGPIHVEGAEPGDQLEVRILAFEDLGWAFTSLIPGLGLLADDFADRGHFLHHWKLEDGQTRSFPGVTLDLMPFAGTMGVQRAEAGSFRTRPPGPFGGNLDVKHLTAGATLFLPVETPGAGFCVGDCHAAQGDGEVCINGMEAPMVVTLEFHLHKQKPLAGPYALTPGPQVPARYQAQPWHTFVESGPEPRAACQAVVRRAIAYLVERLGCSREMAYVLCSVVLDLKVSQLVNVPQTTIAGYLPEAIFD